MATIGQDARFLAADRIRSPQTLAQLRAVLADRWTPASIEGHAVERMLRSASAGWQGARATVLGQSQERIVLINTNCAAYVLSPWRPVRSAPLLGHLPAELKDFSEHAGGFPGTWRPPLVYLVNMVPEQFSHRPSLALGIGMVAGTIERAQCAEVRIFDLNLGVTQAEVLAAIRHERPDVIGAGVDFGEKAACIALFRAIRALPDQGGAPLLVAGNYLAYISATELLAEFPDLLVARGEGERFILDVIEFRQGLKPRSAVSGAIFRDAETGRIVETELARQSPLEWALP